MKELHMSEEEYELSNAKKKVRDLNLKVEEWTSKAKLCDEELEKPKHRKRGQEQRALGIKNSDTFVHFAGVMSDLDKVQRYLSKLKVEVSSISEEKNRAENEAKCLNSRICTYLKSADALRQEIEEVNDEQILVELAEIEASKEFADIETQRELEAQKFTLDIENAKKKMKEILEEIDRSKELEMKLALVNTDIETLKNEIKMVKQMELRVSSLGIGNENESPLVLRSFMEKLELAKTELGSIREDGFKLMASMDVIRKELIFVSEKTVRLKNKEKQADQIVHNLNSKILRAKTKLEAVSSSEEKAKAIVDNLFLTCENLRTEKEASKKDTDFIFEEMTKLKAQTEKNDAKKELAEMELKAALKELEFVQSSEWAALEKLKILTEETRTDRAFISKHSSKITITKFEYEYLTSRAAEAEEIADKKVSAAHAWVKALKANEKEIHMEIENVQRKTREKRKEEDEERFRREKSGNSTPIRRTKLRISTSFGFRHKSRSSSHVKRKEIMPSLSKLFNKSIEDER